MRSFHFGMRTGFPAARGGRIVQGKPLAMRPDRLGQILAVDLRR
jgi:hypothetical protein